LFSNCESDLYIIQKSFNFYKNIFFSTHARTRTHTHTYTKREKVGKLLQRIFSATLKIFSALSIFLRATYLRLKTLRRHYSFKNMQDTRVFPQSVSGTISLS